MAWLRGVRVEPQVRLLPAGIAGRCAKQRRRAHAQVLENFDRCDPERGWRDPDGAPLMVERFHNTLRRCEVVQLRGEALEACRTSLDCPGCGSGWCATEVPELNPSVSSCSAQEQPWPLRFVGGALDAPGGFIYAVCRPPAP